LQGSNALSPALDERKDEKDGDARRFNVVRHFEVSVSVPSTPCISMSAAPVPSTASASTPADGPAPDEGGAENGKRQTYRIDYSLSRMDDVYELRVPRLQIVGGAGTGTGARTSLANSVSVSARSSVASTNGDAASVASMSTSASGSVKEGKEGPAVDEEKRALRREIKAWWEGVADHLDGLVGRLSSLLISLRQR
jgi:1-phosphatidylinositol-3-phosphate 5-kinase